MDESIDVLLSKVSRALEQQRLLAKGDRVLVALSGGGDSVALLLALLERGQALNLEVSAAHVNHGLRGEESDEDENFVRHLCTQRGIALEVARVDTLGETTASGENLEACARRLRYAFLFEKALERGCIVATGHTLNDQVETFLMKLMRGAGPAGLSGISPRRVNHLAGAAGERKVTVIRPLLGVSKQEVWSYLESRQQAYRKDRSNRDLGRDRNWVRHSLIPLLEERLNPNLPATLERTIELFREVNRQLEREGKRVFDACQLSTSGEPRLSIAGIQALDPALQRQLIRRAVAESRGDLKDISLSHVEAVRRLLSAPSGRRLHLPKGLRVEHEFGELLFTRAPVPDPFSYSVTIPGKVFVSRLGKTVRATRVTGKTSPGTVVIDFAGDDLTIRSRRPGDRYRISPQSGEKKLKQLFQRRRVRRSERDRLVVIEGGGRVLWVEGFPSPLSPGAPSVPQAELVEIRVQSETSSA